MSFEALDSRSAPVIKSFPLPCKKLPRPTAHLLRAEGKQIAFVDPQFEDWQDFERHDEPIIPFIPNVSSIISDLEERLHHQNGFLDALPPQLPMGPPFHAS